MYPSKAVDHILAFAHGSILTLANHAQLLSIGLLVLKIVDVLLDALL